MRLEHTEALHQSEADLASVAALIGEPARAAMLTALMDGSALPAGELAELAAVSPQTASAHLLRLLEGGLVRVQAHGRHRYYALGDASVAAALEALMVVAPPRPRRRHLPDEALCYARTCYDHLAGWLGVSLCAAMLERGWLERDGAAFRLTPAGHTGLGQLGVEDSVSAAGRACLDWTERRAHLGGALGRKMTARFLELGWLVRQPSGRALRLTESGRLGLARAFGLRL